MSADPSSYLNQRFVSPADLADSINVERLLTRGRGTDFIGGDPATTGPFYVFVLRPDLNLFGENSDAQRYLSIGTPAAPRKLAEYLSGGTGLIPLLTNLCESYEAQDISLDVHTTGEGWDGAHQTVAKSTLHGRQDGRLSLAFQEWSGTPVTLLHKIWVDYIEAVKKGFLSPSQVNMNARILDYATSIYCFQLLPDARTIEFACRYTGAFPVAVPFSSWSGKIGGADTVKVTVPYAYSFYEAMDAYVINDFNSSIGSRLGISVGLGTPYTGAGNTERSTDRFAYYLNFDEAPKTKPDGI